MMQFLGVLVFIFAVIGARCDSESLIENQKDFLHTFHHGQQHGHIGAGSDAGASSGAVGIPGGAHLLSGSQYQDQSLVPQEQISGGHSVVGQLGQGSVLGGGPYVGAPVVPPYGGHKSDVQLHLGGARAISNYLPYAARTYSAPVYQPSALPYFYGGYSHVYQPHVYQPSLYSAVTPYSSHLPAPVYVGYSGYNYPYGHLPSGYPVAYQPANEVQPVGGKQ